MNGKNGDFRIRKDLAVFRLAPALLLLCAAFLAFRMQHSSPPDGEGARRAALVRTAAIRWEISRRSHLSFGYRNLLADLTWLEAVQVSGARVLAREDYDRLYMLLQTVANYDPRFVIPFLLGGLTLGDSPQHVQEALDLLSRGRKFHPGDWRFPFYVGYLHYFNHGDLAAGGRALEEASRIPGSPPYLALLASRMLTEGREPETALAFLGATLAQESDPDRKKIIERRIREVIVERDVQLLEGAVGAYRGVHGSAPESLQDLVRAGLIRRIPAEPNGGSYLLSPDGSVRSSRIATRLKVFRKGGT